MMRQRRQQQMEQERGVRPQKGQLRLTVARTATMHRPAWMLLQRPMLWCGTSSSSAPSVGGRQLQLATVTQRAPAALAAGLAWHWQQLTCQLPAKAPAACCHLLSAHEAAGTQLFFSSRGSSTSSRTQQSSHQPGSLSSLAMRSLALAQAGWMLRPPQASTQQHPCNHPLQHAISPFSAQQRRLVACPASGSSSSPLRVELNQHQLQEQVQQQAPGARARLACPRWVLRGLVLWLHHPLGLLPWTQGSCRCVCY